MNSNFSDQVEISKILSINLREKHELEHKDHKSDDLIQVIARDTEEKILIITIISRSSKTKTNYR